jgi:predicted ribosome quality control (RQC) complex YloA/Tae2 family protein
MQTALHIYSLVKELNDNILGSRFSGTAFYKKEREAYLFFKKEKGKFALGLSYHPVGFGAFLIPAGKINIDTNEKPWPFFQPAEGGTVISVRQIGLDRIFRISIEGDSAKYEIIFEAIGPNGNIWLLDERDVIMATLRHKKFDPSTKYMPPSSMIKLNPFEINNTDISALLKSQTESTIGVILRKNLIGLDEYLVNEILFQAGITGDISPEAIDESTISRLVETIKAVAHKFDDYHHGYYYETTAGRGVYPFRLHYLKEDYHKSSSLSPAIYEAIKTHREVKEGISETQKVTDTVARWIKKLERKVVKVDEDVAAADRFEEYRRYAELLKINLSSMKRGMDKIVLKDIYLDTGGEISIPLEPALSPAENADEYFKKYRKGKEGLALLERRGEVARQELANARRILSALENNYETALQQYRTEIEELLPQAVDRKETAPRLPYKPYTLSSGVTIFVGRDGTDNDSTTFGHAKPYELWFHASQCPGSHVVMKFPDKNFKPSKAEILETAAIAAYHSKAKNSKTVPVIYTERRYVRKPRKAKPGLVTVEREKMVMVEPKKAD